METVGSALGGGLINGRPCYCSLLVQLDKLHSWLLFSLLFAAQCARPHTGREQTNIILLTLSPSYISFPAMWTWHIIYASFTFLLLFRIICMKGQWKEYTQHAAGQRLLRSRGWVVLLSCCCAERRKRAVRQQLWRHRSRWLRSLPSAAAVIKSYPVTPCLPFQCALRAVIAFFLYSISWALWKYLPWFQITFTSLSILILIWLYCLHYMIFK